MHFCLLCASPYSIWARRRSLWYIALLPVFFSPFVISHRLSSNVIRLFYWTSHCTISHSVSMLRESKCRFWFWRTTEKLGDKRIIDDEFEWRAAVAMVALRGYRPVQNITFYIINSVEEEITLWGHKFELFALYATQEVTTWSCFLYSTFHTRDNSNNNNKNHKKDDVQFRSIWLSCVCGFFPPVCFQTITSCTTELHDHSQRQFLLLFSAFFAHFDYNECLPFANCWRYITIHSVNSITNLIDLIIFFCSLGDGSRKWPLPTRNIGISLLISPQAMDLKNFQSRYLATNKQKHLRVEKCNHQIECIEIGCNS